ncbi:MAG TPA: ABC transporter substrate-binding protein, partial [Paraburkholderia sp.]
MNNTKPWMRAAVFAAFAAVSVCGAGTAAAQVKIGVTLSTTGPAASLGIPEKNTIALLPKEIGGKTVQYIVLDDGSDTSKAVQNTHKLIDEDHVDAIIGSTVTPNALAMLDPAAEGKTPVISLAASAAI